MLSRNVVNYQSSAFKMDLKGGKDRLFRNVVNYQHTYHNIPEERRSHLHRGRYMKSITQSWKSRHCKWTACRQMLPHRRKIGLAFFYHTRTAVSTLRRFVQRPLELHFFFRRLAIHLQVCTVSPQTTTVRPKWIIRRCYEKVKSLCTSWRTAPLIPKLCTWSAVNITPYPPFRPQKASAPTE
jgi:hypothetical protein